MHCIWTTLHFLQVLLLCHDNNKCPILCSNGRGKSHIIKPVIKCGAAHEIDLFRDPRLDTSFLLLTFFISGGRRRFLCLLVSHELNNVQLLTSSNVSSCVKPLHFITFKDVDLPSVSCVGTLEHYN